MRDKILEEIKVHTQNNDYESNSVVEISKRLQVSRNVVASEIRQLFAQGKLIKINQKPILYVVKEIFEEIHNQKVDTLEVDSLHVLTSTNSDEKRDFEKLIGYDGSLSELVSQCKGTISYPPNGLPMMLYGPTGTGKSYIARLTYEYAKHKGLLSKEQRFISVNCSEYANNPELLTANLFGHVKGAFTGADKDNEGLIALADGGILFLDEVHNLSPECQEKLFQFMDLAEYHRVGDNENWYASNVKLIFATTEKPEDVLLKTLLRRIPMTITVPSLKERGLHERVELLYSMFKTEQDKLQKKIRISAKAYSIFLAYDFPGNIGGLRGCIQTCCIQAMFSNQDDDAIVIQLHDLPKDILESEQLQSITTNFENTGDTIAVDELDSFIKAESYIIQMLHNVLTTFQTYTENDANISEMDVSINQNIHEYFDKILYHATLSTDKDFYYKGIENIFDMIRNRYGLSLSNNDILTLNCFIMDYRKNYISVRNWSYKQAEQISELLSYLENHKYYETNITKEITNYLHAYLDLDILDIVKIVFMFYLSNVTNHKSEKKRLAVILAHGFSTASSIAEATNQFLDTYVFDAIDMPINQDVQTIIKKLNEYLNSMGKFEELFLLVDMGSLEDIYKGIQNKQANIGIINNISTKTALEIGNGIIQNRPMEDIFDEVIQYSKTHYHIEKNQLKKNVILCSCASGMGTAEKLRRILKDSLPVDVPIEVQTYNYNELVEKGIHNKVFTDNHVLFIVGTLNPNIENLPFIPIEELIITDSFAVLNHELQSIMSAEQLDTFKKKILKNFSLSNIMSSLTILNPNKLLEHVADALDRLQNALDKTLSSSTCFGLYVHISCLIERLVMNKEVETYLDVDEFTKENQNFINLVKQTFREVEEYYGVDISIPEIGYIYDYIKND
ncbi:sigma-54 dependent transcriptional regulator of gfr operon [Breznakia blatticola]|uniref:Sigma-54 dependent transcriptional regulator of gfr operon n=1 Tax=Breznakia blatticola TaxID=1754012 RepID=A0A4R8A555_9FIRM|nr:sigma 54-interacting transcriptional regulator [Breznakia blatticola]TDW25760.1 sigma-54 dependent transcriptional regulator of gfr operon [Breznakia blatticola]